jgi:hypothetical protein
MLIHLGDLTTKLHKKTSGFSAKFPAQRQRALTRTRRLSAQTALRAQSRAEISVVEFETEDVISQSGAFTYEKDELDG